MGDSSDERVTDAGLTEVERLDAAATPGPWSSDGGYVWFGSSGGDDGAELFDLTPSARVSDGEIAAEARTLLPRACRDIRAVRQAARDLSEAADACEDARSLYDAIKAFCANVLP